MSNQRALIVDDEPDIRELVALALGRMGLHVDEAGDVAAGKQALASNNYNVCLTDLRLPDGSGLDLVEHIHDQQLPTPIAVITAYGDLETAVQALKLGAFDFVSKPLDLGKLRQLVSQALRRPATTPHPEAEQETQNLLIGESAPMQNLKELIRRVARSQAPALISGESGTGKELVARQIHAHSGRADGPFVPVNCGAIPGELMESEFFGHKKGSFTGANADKPGLFASADGGTLFLDEIADLPLHMQVKLLRVLQEKTIRPVGANREIPVDVRIVSATHKNLQQTVSDGAFREDLYYRINVIELAVPSLRERREDIPRLAQAIVKRLADANGMPASQLADGVIAWLQQQPFPGNVREMENTLERALVLSNDGAITTDDFQSLASSISETKPKTGLDTLSPGTTLEEHLEAIERHLIERALTATNQNKTAAAEQLGMSFRQLRYRTKKLGLDD